MKKEELLSTITSIGIQPNKKLGQNFLLDNNLLNYIVRSANIQKDDHILEIGPGLGALTEKLIENSNNLTVIEFDAKIFSYLKAKHGEKLNLIHQDACRSNIDQLMGNIPFKLVSNLPYSITTPLLANVISLTNIPNSIILLLQKETALRLTSDNSSKNYGAITIRLQTVYKTEYLRSVPPDVFYPKPDVDSAIIKLIKKENIPSLEDRKKLDILVKTAFLKRRKKLLSTIKPLFKTDIKEIFKNLGFDEKIRPENLTPEEFLELAKYI